MTPTIDDRAGSGSNPPSKIDRLAAWLLAPKDAAALAAFRIAFGVIAFIAAIRFLSYGWADQLLVEPRFHFHFWGASWVRPLGEARTHALFIVLAAAGACIAAGLFYRVAIVVFFLGFSYAELIEATSYLNHYYLISLLALLMATMPLGRVWSLDALIFGKRRGAPPETLPAWCTYLLRFQIGVVYTFAGVAKLNADWLVHAQPLSIWLSSRADTPVIGPLFALPPAAHLMSWAGCLFDLFVVWFLLHRRTRPFAFAAVITFHTLTRVLFPIGMFPFVMVTAATVFLSPSWPRRFLPRRLSAPPALPDENEPATLTRAPRWLRPALAVFAAHAALQVLIPLRSLLYRNVLWDEQGMRFSWRVMVVQKTASVRYRVENPVTGRVIEVPPSRYLTPRQDREFGTQPDLILQLAHRIADDYSVTQGVRVRVHVDALASLNGRRAARLVDPDVDLAAITDSLAPATWILPAPTDPPPRLRRAMAMGGR